MGNSLMAVVAVGVIGVVMFVFPLLAVSQSGDDVSQLAVQSATTEFIDQVRSTGKLTLDDYDKYVQTINATGNTYDVELEIKRKDENPGKKTAQTQYEKIGENTYYVEYTTQIKQALNKPGGIKLKEGDIVSATVKNTNMTISQTLRNFFYKVTGNNTYQIGASHSGIVTVNAQ